ncbi:MAG: KH domain-containing protein [Acidimicrobiia bacterium]|nr:KH domain-containing protein [Acidimicrobiia bacterium]
MMKGQIVESVVKFIVSEIAEDLDSLEVSVTEEGPDEVVAEVRASKPDMGRVIGRRGRVAKSIRILAQAAADEEGLQAQVEFAD